MSSRLGPWPGRSPCRRCRRSAVPRFRRGTFRVAPVGLRAGLSAPAGPPFSPPRPPLVVSAGVCGALDPALSAWATSSCLTASSIATGAASPVTRARPAGGRRAGAVGNPAAMVVTSADVVATPEAKAALRARRAPWRWTWSPRPSSSRGRRRTAAVPRRARRLRRRPRDAPDELIAPHGHRGPHPSRRCASRSRAPGLSAARAPAPRASRAGARHGGGALARWRPTRPAMDALVTGGTGFVGANLVRELLADGRTRARPRAQGRRSQRARGLRGRDRRGRPLDADSLRAAVAGAGASTTSPPTTGSGRATRASSTAPMWTARATSWRPPREAGAERIVYTSTVGALGIPKDGTPGDETTPVGLEDMVGPYKASKFLAERVADEWAARGAPIVIVNPSAPIGPWDVKPTPTGQMIVDFLRGKMLGSIDTGLNIVHVRDVARGHILAAERGRSGESYVLGNQQPVPHRDLPGARAAHRDPCAPLPRALRAGVADGLGMEGVAASRAGHPRCRSTPCGWRASACTSARPRPCDELGLPQTPPRTRSPTPSPGSSTAATPQTREGGVNAAQFVSRLTRKSRSNFFYAFLCLPRAQRDALYAVYAFCRIVDDAVDVGEDRGEQRRELDRWREEIGRVYGRTPEHPAGERLQEAVRAFPSRARRSTRSSTGVEMDLDHSTLRDLRGAVPVLLPRGLRGRTLRASRSSAIAILRARDYAVRPRHRAPAHEHHARRPARRARRACLSPPGGSPPLRRDRGGSGRGAVYARLRRAHDREAARAREYTSGPGPRCLPPTPPGSSPRRSWGGRTGRCCVPSKPGASVCSAGGSRCLRIGSSPSRSPAGCAPAGVVAVRPRVPGAPDG